MPQPFEELDHTADAGVLVHGQSAEQTLARLVLALSAVLTGGGAVSAERDLTVQVERGDRAAMAVDVLRELLFRFECEMVVPESCAVTRFDPEHGCIISYDRRIEDATGERVMEIGEGPGWISIQEYEYDERGNWTACRYYNVKKGKKLRPKDMYLMRVREIEYR